MVTAIETIDIKASYKASARRPEIMTVPRVQFVMIDGHGDPITSPHPVSHVEHAK